MKWPNTLTVVRHEESAYNELRDRKLADPLYQEFRDVYDNRRKENPQLLIELAHALMANERYLLSVGDHDTDTTERGAYQAVETGKRLAERIEVPDVIFVSPYKRTLTTLGHMAIGWPALAKIKPIEDERLREQEHGLALLYND